MVIAPPTDSTLKRVKRVAHTIAGMLLVVLLMACCIMLTEAITQLFESTLVVWAIRTIAVLIALACGNRVIRSMPESTPLEKAFVTSCVCVLVFGAVFLLTFLGYIAFEHLQV